MPSSDLHIEGFLPPDEKWCAMKDIWDSCQKAGVKVPEEVNKFFDHEDPHTQSPMGTKVNLDGHECRSEYSEDMTDGVYVDLQKLPEGITLLRVSISY